jgi:uncharacterized protein Veg
MRKREREVLLQNCKNLLQSKLGAKTRLKYVACQNGRKREKVHPEDQ